MITRPTQFKFMLTFYFFINVLLRCAYNTVIYSLFFSNYLRVMYSLVKFFFFFFIGRCASYYFSGNLIKRNLRTKCSAFEEKPCPIFYRSDKAYNCKSFSLYNIHFMLVYLFEKRSLSDCSDIAEKIIIR